VFFSDVVNASNEYTVFLMKGKIEIIENGQVKPLDVSSKIDENAVIIVHKDSYLSLRSSERKRHTISIKGSYRGKVKSIDKACRKKRSKEFMILTEGKKASDFQKDGRFYMSGGGYNTRDIFITEEQENAINDLIDLLEEAEVIDGRE
jgi:hypothetical protein